MAKVFIGVGHGGSDPGATANGFREKDLNLDIALACKDVLVRHGVLVRMSRTKDENDTLNEEIKECNAYNPDLAVDIHNNAGGGDGAEALCSIGGGKGKTLAEYILREIVAIGQNSRGVKTKKNSAGRDWYGFIRETACPACIIETAFVDNRKDMEIIDSEAERKTMGVAIAKGILKTLGIALVPSVLEWQKAAIADGFKFPKYGADGKWGAECEGVAKNAIVRWRGINYKYPNLTKIVQKLTGANVDGLCGKATETKIIEYQEAHGLEADGIVGVKTWEKILGV